MDEAGMTATAGEVSSERYIGKLKGTLPGPTMIFMGGVHGNEPSGVKALENVLTFLTESRTIIHGNIIALRGNIPALKRGARYYRNDLNRMWTFDAMRRIESKDPAELNEDEKQQKEIHEEIQRILAEEAGPFYFLDLHTTSGSTVPFMTVNDSLLNRSFAWLIPTPVSYTHLRAHET